MQWKKHLIWLIPLLILDVVALFFYFNRSDKNNQPAQAADFEAESMEAELNYSQLSSLTFPTDQTNLLSPEMDGIFQATASGRPESALYGSTRSGKRGKIYTSTFHEGIDIAALRRDRHSRPLDLIYAVADGKIAYLNRIAGNSNYGKYIVLAHEDTMGRVYSLYAHLAQINSELRAGEDIEAGKAMGIMGHTASTGIPLWQAHLHLEIGVILNRNFKTWYRAQKLVPDHGNYHGWNLLGVDPLEVFAAQQASTSFNLQQYFTAQVPAFEAVLKTKLLPDYFQRYAGLWTGEEFVPPAIVVVCSENGVPLRGRNANADEAAALKNGQAVIQNVNREVLGRNGAHLIREQNGAWILGKSGEQWREMLLYF